MLYQDDKSIPDVLSDMNGISLMPLPYAVVKAPASYYQNKAQNIEIALSMVESVYNITRFLMNFMLVTAGYPWTILRVTERTGYMRSLDLVATDKDIKPFAGFIPDYTGIKIVRNSGQPGLWLGYPYPGYSKSHRLNSQLSLSEHQPQTNSNSNH